MKITNKIAIITGGCSGLGEAAVHRFIDQGAKISIFDLNQSAGEKLIEQYGKQHIAYHNVDVSNQDAVQQAVANTEQQFGNIHILCNYAGILLPEKIVNREKQPCGIEKFSKTIQVNLIGTFNLIRYTSAVMVKNQPENDCRGVIINTASIAAFEGQIGQASYSASKAGIIGMTLPIARDLEPWGIRVNSIAPGIIHTPIFDNVKEAVYKSLKQQVLFPKRLGKPDEVAHLVQHIVENDYINAETIRLDGGIRMQAK